MSPWTIQNIEYVYGNSEQYLLIHKCGNSSVRHAMGNPEMGDVPRTNKTTFTVIRDPIDRFISGFIYDLYNSSVVDDSLSCSDLESVVLNHISNRDIYDVYEYIDGYKRGRGGVLSTGAVSHTIPQISYVVGQPIDMFIHLNDLSLFLQLHYGQSPDLNSSRTPTIKYNIIKQILLRDEQRLRDIHQIDYYYINQLKQNGMFWSWQNGRIF